MSETSSAPGPFESSLDERIVMMTLRRSGDQVVASGFDGAMNLQQLRYARSLLTRAILDLVKAETR